MGQPLAATAADVTLTAAEQDTLLGIAAANTTKETVRSDSQSAGQPRAWDARARLD